MPDSKLFATFRTLCQRDIQFIVVGGLAAFLNGAPVQTYDVDLVYSSEQANVDRLLNFLQEIDTIFRIQPERRLRPTSSHLPAGGHLNLPTSYGPVDPLATIGQNLGFSDLLPHSDEMDIGEGIRVRVLNLETLISNRGGIGFGKGCRDAPDTAPDTPGDDKEARYLTGVHRSPTSRGNPP